MKQFLVLLALAAVASAQCPLTSYLSEDAEEYLEDAAELGWYDDAGVNVDNIVADVGQDVYDGCQSLSDGVNEDNVKDSVCDFYGEDCGGTASGGSCWEDEQVLQDAQDVIFFDCLGLDGEEDDFDNSGDDCPFTSKVEKDWEDITEEAEDQGWYADGNIDLDAVAASIGEDATDACQSLSQEITDENVAEVMRDFYNIEGGEAADPAGGPCWTENEDIVRESKQLVFFDCAFAELEG